MADILQHLINGIGTGSIYSLMALGYTMVYGILQLINFAHSDVYMVGAFSAYYLSQRLHLTKEPGLVSLLLLLFGSMLVCSLLGLAIERFAYRPLRSAPKLNILITAIGVSLLLQFSGQLLFGADPKVFPEVIKDSLIFEMGQFQFKTNDMCVLSVTVLAMVTLNLFIKHTAIGRAMRAVSQSRTNACLMGINPDRVIALTFVVGSCLAGIASVLVGMKYPKIDPLMGAMIGMKAFVAAVLGGIGNLTGAVLGGLVMGLSEEFVAGYLSSTYKDALAFLLLIVILVYKPSGLLGRHGVEKV